MAVVTYVFRADDLERELLVELTGAVNEEVLDIARDVKKRVGALIKSRSSQYATGRLAGSLDVLFEPAEADFPEAIGIVSSPEKHALWFEEGTGIFGPRKAFIFSSGVMTFVPRPVGVRARVFTMYTKGQRGKHPFRDGLNQVASKRSQLRRFTF